MGIFRKQDESYEIRLKSKDSKKLEKIIERISEKTGLKRPHKIIISDGSEIAVSGLYKKKLIIGLATLRLLDEDDLMAIIAHEYGHFAKKDTIFGYLAYRIQNFIVLQEEINRQNLSLSLTLIIYLPTWLLFFALSHYFAITNLWYSRRIEYRADKFAADIVGNQKYANALIKYCVIAEIFEDVVPHSIAHYLNQNKQLVNIYEFMKQIYSEENIKKSYHRVLSAESGWLSSHPSISERIEALGIEDIELSIDFNTTPIVENQEKYEKRASEIMTQKMAYWMQINAQQEQSEEEE